MALSRQVIGLSIIVFSLLLIGGGIYLRHLSSIDHFSRIIGRRFMGQDENAALEYLGFRRAIDCLRKGIGRTDDRPVFIMARQRLSRQRISVICLVLGALGVSLGAGLVFIRF